MPTQTTHPSDLALGQTYTYKATIRVTVFGRERDEHGLVKYYWVRDGAGNKFKAWPNELGA